jgi:microcystin degradation protein MlrC
MHIFLAALAHETNSFSPIPTTLRAFEEGILYRPGGAEEQRVAAHDFPGYGFLLDVAREHGDRVTAGLCAWAQPGGPVTRQVYEALRDELLAQLAAAGPFDVVVLVLHGAMIAHGFPDCEGDLLARVRDVVGPGVPVGALLDLHATLTPRMTESGAVLIACKEYPHTDYLARTRELHAILARMAGGTCLSAMVMHKVPMLSMFGTAEGPMRALLDRVQECEAEPDILSISLIHGFPWSDTAETGAAVLVVFDKGHGPAAAGRAAALAAQLAQAFFALRALGSKTMLPVHEAVTACLAACAGGPVVLADGSDNPGGGAACDSTFVLRELIDRGVEGAALGMLWDPLAVQLASDAGVGAELALRIGGKVGPASGAPVDVLATVTAVRRDARQHGLAAKFSEALGDAVAIRTGGIDIVLNTRRQQVFSPECFTELGIDVTARRLLVVKSSRHFRACFDPIASATFFCDAPGSLNSDLAQLPYVHLRRPIWPLDALEDTALTGSPEASHA